MDQLKDSFKRDRPNYSPRVSLRYLKIGYGQASAYAHHLKHAFPDVILEVKIGMDHLLLIINEEADEEELAEFEQLFSERDDQ